MSGGEVQRTQIDFHIDVFVRDTGYEGTPTLSVLDSKATFKFSSTHLIEGFQFPEEWSTRGRVSKIWKDVEV